MRVYGYIRVSTETQVEKGYGLDIQEGRIRAHAAENGLTLSAVFSDAGISAAADEWDGEDALSRRPGLVSLLGALQRGDCVVVLNTSRLWRSDTAKVLIRREMTKRGCQVVSLEQPSYDLYARNPNERLIAGIWELLDEWERLSISLKLARGRTAKASRGVKPAGVCPYGYAYAGDKKSLVPVPEEASVIRRIFSEAARGKSLGQIASLLASADIHTRRGNLWGRSSLQAVLRNDFYVGILTHQGRKEPGTHPPLVSRSQFGKASAKLSGRRKQGVTTKAASGG